METARTSTLTVHTPEGIVFPLPLAGPLSRFVAWLVDLACIIVGCNLIVMPLRILALVSPDLANALAITAYFVVSIGYGIVAEWAWRGQTLGKRLVQLRVMDAQGLRLRFSQVVIRNLLRVVDMMPLCYMVGGLSCLFSGKAQRLGDIAAGTIVVRIPTLREPDLAPIEVGKYNSFRAHPRLVARLRQEVSPAEAGVALQALQRRDRLAPAARIELFAQLAAWLRQRVEFPPEASENLSDEQYVRNAVDVLFRT